MKKSIFTLLFICMLSLITGAPVFAEEQNTENSPAMIYDKAYIDVENDTFDQNVIQDEDANDMFISDEQGQTDIITDEYENDEDTKAPAEEAVAEETDVSESRKEQSENVDPVIDASEGVELEEVAPVKEPGSGNIEETPTAEGEKDISEQGADLDTETISQKTGETFQTAGSVILSAENTSLHPPVASPVR